LEASSSALKQLNANRQIVPLPGNIKQLLSTIVALDECGQFSAVIGTPV